ncbi:MAG: radical SAM protein [Nitrospirae bacterium]|nr:radical SAM protein [Candidatus Manganitrophaceae bacterium]
MKVNEIFKSIQGESSYAGLPCIFLRTTYCNLRCHWCDTAYAFHEGTERSVESVLQEIRGYGCDLVEITGGEPLLQDEIYPLIRTLLDEGYRVLIETSGSVPIDRVDPRAVIIMDIKCPGSRMSHTVCWENLNRLKGADEVKFVIADRADYMWAKEILSRYPSLTDRTVLFSPVFDQMEPRQLAEWILEDRLPIRFQLQLHKYIWDPQMRGV